ncbi:hydantoinase/oxoprolinase family protein [Stakelama tenebrarum]|uniref:Hydantoinase/oxoprolinase family protein n=1 Tax=Stakelama tenebrarum TaxID=2711215 RepID=A0A6G6Y2D9_9SPHN|nr:hydantoinase/oxoprolinase family protein [Sphingosinithalassobacter tenebrarum]QIG78773.1 hydantoinase/oxoprolinase family protein [Sphingosinithalassobacter tenebrarum]
MTPMRTARIGVDIGGTFTDLVLHDEARGITHTGKRLTTPEAPSRAIIEGIGRLLAETGTEPEQISAIVHGTTLVTNTVLERTGARVGLIATDGLTDQIEMGRETRYDTDNLFQPAVPVIVPRDLRRGVIERILADGTVHTPLDVAMLEAQLRSLVDAGVEALAIAFMNAYRNPEHELRAKAVAERLFPNLPVTISSAVAPEIREYERTNTACVNAYVQPRVRGYLDRLTEELAAMGFAGDLSIMLSSGGVTTIEEAKAFPVRLIESGPAAGAIAAAHIARKIGEDHLISFDMGGTTAKMCLIENATPHVKHDFEAGRLERFKQGSGLPLKVAVVDMIEISGGGGSIAAVDKLGLMKVGPRSASSVPGPVAYGLGGTEPTVTDADLLLGYLNPEFFLGGEMALRLDDVRSAIAERLADPLGMRGADAAAGIQGIVNESMAAATRMHLAEKGKDPRDYTMLAFGGAGPVHAYALARLLGVRRLVVPMGAGVISAFGFLVAAPAVNDSRGYFERLERVDWQHVSGLYGEMEARARNMFAAMGARADDIQIEYAADMRYSGQGFEITVPLPENCLEGGRTDAVREAFQTRYRQLFNRSVENIPVEAVNWRLSASLPAQDISLAHNVRDEPAERGTRDVTFPGHGPVPARVYNRYALQHGVRIEGPAVFEERESSFIIGPEAVAEVDEHANLVVTIDYANAAHGG